MTDFILIPAVVGICTYTFYKFVEVLAHRKERLRLVEKISELPEACNTDLSRFFGTAESSRFLSLRFGMILLGIGFGLLIAFGINSICFCDQLYGPDRAPYHVREVADLIYGACTLICGGLGLLGSFLLEQKYRNGKR